MTLNVGFRTPGPDGSKHANASKQDHGATVSSSSGGPLSVTPGSSGTSGVVSTTIPSGVRVATADATPTEIRQRVGKPAEDCDMLGTNPCVLSKGDAPPASSGRLPPLSGGATVALRATSNNLVTPQLAKSLMKAGHENSEIEKSGIHKLVLGNPAFVAAVGGDPRPQGELEAALAAEIQKAAGGTRTSVPGPAIQKIAQIAIDAALKVADRYFSEAQVAQIERHFSNANIVGLDPSFVDPKTGKPPVLGVFVHRANDRRCGQITVTIPHLRDARGNAVTGDRSTAQINSALPDGFQILNHDSASHVVTIVPTGVSNARIYGFLDVVFGVKTDGIACVVGARKANDPLCVAGVDPQYFSDPFGFSTFLFGLVKNEQAALVVTSDKLFQGGKLDPLLLPHLYAMLVSKKIVAIVPGAKQENLSSVVAELNEWAQRENKPSLSNDALHYLVFGVDNCASMTTAAK